MSKIPFSKIKKVKDLYYRQLFSMKKVAEELGVSIDAVVYFMRKHDLKRRSVSENEKIKFARKPLSFKIPKKATPTNSELKIIGSMLYWGEGAKGGKHGTNATVDFANSDTRMVSLFLKFLRNFCKVDETRLRALVYCYADQSYPELLNFWSSLTKIPKSQFTKPFIRKDFRKDGRKMKYGLIHIRYNDKKLLIEIENMIDWYVCKHASVG